MTEQDEEPGDSDEDPLNYEDPMIAMTRLRYAITFCNNHIPHYGARSSQPLEDFRPDDGPMIDDLSPGVRNALDFAMENALRYIGASFPT